MLRAALVVVIPSACTTTTTAIDAGGESDAVASRDVSRIDATDALPIFVNPPPPTDVFRFDIVDITDTPWISENPPFPWDVLYADAVTSPDVSADALATDAASPADAGCAQGQRFCGGRCVDVGPHANACTPCGLPCCAGGFCNGGQCAVGCAAGWTLCANPDPSPRCEGGICAPLFSDTRNCGRCGVRCADGERCLNGVCAP